MKNILILGASGLTGQALLKQALADDSIEQIKIIVRAKLNLEHPKLSQYVSTFEDIPDITKLFVCDAVFCCLGSTIKKAGSKSKFRQVDVLLIEQLAQLAKATNAGQFVVISAQGADVKSWFYYNKCKGEMENRVSYALSNSQTKLTICQPSLLLGQRNENRLVEQLAITISPLLSWLWPLGLQNFQPIQATDLAAAMLTLAKANKVNCMLVTNRNLHNVVKTINAKAAVN